MKCMRVSDLMVYGLMAAVVLCAPGPAARAQEKPAAAGDVSALPWQTLRESWRPAKNDEAFKQRKNLAYAELTRREGEVYRQIAEGKVEEAYPTVFDMSVMLEWLTWKVRGQGCLPYFESRAKVLLDQAGQERRAAQRLRAEEAMKKSMEEARQEYESVLKTGIQANPEWAAAERRFKEATAKLETLGVNERGEPKDRSRKLRAEEATAATGAAKVYKEAEAAARRISDVFHKEPENWRLRAAADKDGGHVFLYETLLPQHNEIAYGGNFWRERLMCYNKLGYRGKEWLLDGPDPALDPALPRIDESGRKPGTSKTLDLGGGVKLELVWIPPGEFMMGSPTNEPGRSMTERLHRVKLTKGFWMGKYEATQEQWQRVMGNNPSWFQNAGPRAPVETVRRDQVQKFIRKLSELAAGKDGGKFRLPTEAEWEWACRAGATTALYNGKMTIKTGNNSPELSSIAWYAGNSGVDYEGGVLSTLWEDKEQEHHSAGTHPVGRKQPNAWGLYDMLGNVAEWCEDWNYAYPSKAVTDPTGPKKNMGDANMGEHVLRGGCWQNGVRICRSAARNWTVLEHGWRSATVGFRIVLEDSPAENAK